MMTHSAGLQDLCDLNLEEDDLLMKEEGFELSRVLQRNFGSDFLSHPEADSAFARGVELHSNHIFQLDAEFDLGLGSFDTHGAQKGAPISNGKFKGDEFNDWDENPVLESCPSSSGAVGANFQRNWRRMIAKDGCADVPFCEQDARFAYEEPETEPVAPRNRIGVKRPRHRNTTTNTTVEASERKSGLESVLGSLCYAPATAQPREPPCRVDSENTYSPTPARFESSAVFSAVYRPFCSIGDDDSDIGPTLEDVNRAIRHVASETQHGCCFKSPRQESANKRPRIELKNCFKSRMGT